MTKEEWIVLGLTFVFIVGGFALVAVTLRIRPHPGAAMTHACVTSNLNAIHNAKQKWAAEHHRSPTDIPTDPDLFGSEAYIREKPVCPAGGVYSLNPVNQKPGCSMPAHMLK